MSVWWIAAAVVGVLVGPIVLIVVFAALLWLVALIASPTSCFMEGSTDPFWELFGGRPSERRRDRQLRDMRRWQDEVDDIRGRTHREDVKPPHPVFDEVPSSLLWTSPPLHEREPDWRTWNDPW